MTATIAILYLSQSSNFQASQCKHCSSAAPACPQWRHESRNTSCTTVVADQHACCSAPSAMALPPSAAVRALTAHLYVFVQSISVILTIYTDNCKLIHQVASLAVPWASFRTWSCFDFELIILSLTFQSLNRVMGHPCHGFICANFQLVKPFHSPLRVRHRTDRQMTVINA